MIRFLLLTSHILHYIAALNIPTIPFLKIYNEGNINYKKITIKSWNSESNFPEIIKKNTKNIIQSSIALANLSFLATYINKKNINNRIYNNPSQLLHPWAIKTIQQGNIYIHDNWISNDLAESLRQEIYRRVETESFKTSGLSNTALGKTQDFNNNKDRAVCAIPLYEPNGLNSSDASGQAALREISHMLTQLRGDLSHLLHRPSLNDETLPHEAYFSRYRKGSSLKRHLDEKHEETKGITWLLYLSDANWTAETNGGALRAFPQNNINNNDNHNNNNIDSNNINTYSIDSSDNGGAVGGVVGGGVMEEGYITGSHEGDLQVGWLTPSSSSSEKIDGNGNGDVMSGPNIPVFLDCWRPVVVNTIYGRDSSVSTGSSGEYLSALYVTTQRNPTASGTTTASRSRSTSVFSASASSSPSKQYITTDFDVSQRRQSLNQKDLDRDRDRFVAPEDFLHPEYAQRFFVIEDQQLWAAGGVPVGSRSVDVLPLCARLILFDSVVIPHEVMGVVSGERLALAGCKKYEAAV
eukprot:gene8292-17053_t